MVRVNLAGKSRFVRVSGREAFVIIQVGRTWIMLTVECGPAIEIPHARARKVSPWVAV